MLFIVQAVGWTYFVFVVRSDVHIFLSKFGLHSVLFQLTVVQWSLVDLVASGAGSRPFPVCILSCLLTQIMTSVTQLSAAESQQRMSLKRCELLCIYEYKNTCIR